MRSTLFAIAIMASAATVKAQKFEFGLSGGVASYSVHDNYMGIAYQDFKHFQSAVVAPIAGLKAIYNTGKYQVGLGVEGSSFSYKCIRYPEAGPFMSPMPVVQFKTLEMPVSLFANRVIKARAFVLYGGLSVQYIVSNTQPKVIYPPAMENGGNIANSRIGGAAQAGATWFVTKHLGINAEVAAQYSRPAAGPLDKNKVIVPAMLGIHYKL